MLQIFNQVKLSKQTLLATVIGLAVFNAVLYLQLDARIPSKLKANTEELLSIFSKIHHRHKNLDDVHIRSEVYDEIFSQVNIHEFLQQELYAERCLAYFNHLSMSSPDWLIDPHEQVDMKNEAFRTFEEYEEQRLAQWQKDADKAEEENGSPKPKPTRALMRKEYEDIVEKMQKDEQLLHDFTSHVRVFDRCFLDGYKNEQSKNSFVAQQRNFLKRTIDFEPTLDVKSFQSPIHKNQVACSDIESKIFPFLSREYPIFTRWDGTKHFFPGSKLSGLPNKECFITDFRLRINGKGIVITIGDNQLDDAARLIRILRYFRNSYPIQIMYHSGLSDLSMDRIVLIAREDYHGFPAQDIWFVNIKRAIKPSYLNKFDGFANKILAMVFNSFEEVLFLDADAAILKSPDYFFSLKKYVETGAYFYRDRAALDSRGRADIKFFQKLLPSIEDSMVFNIEQTNNYTLENGFFNGMGHYMESGIVIVNRKKHFIQPFMMSVISFYNPVNGRIYGDKEMFWLAVAISGRNDYHFNENAAAAVGELMPASEQSNPNMKAKKLCSAHPAHISGEDNHTLVWINSGFRFCSKARTSYYSSKDDFQRQEMFKWFKTEEEMVEMFDSALVVKHAIIPPFSPKGSVRNNEDEPQDFWHMTSYCYNYMWCAYSRVGGKYNFEGEVIDNHIDGQLIELGDEQTLNFAKVASYWIQELPWLNFKGRSAAS